MGTSGGGALSLEQLRVASPCPASWDGMAGDDRVRFCGECRLHVYNLSGMSRVDAEGLIERTEGRLCVRMLRRADGTVITRDCPVGLARVHRAIRRGVLAAVALIGTAVVGGWVTAAGDETPALDELEPFATVRAKVLGEPAWPPNCTMLGAVWIPPTTTSASP